MGGGHRADGTGTGYVAVVDADGAVESVQVKPIDQPRLLLAGGRLVWAAADGLWAWGEQLTHLGGPPAEGSLISLSEADDGRILAVQNEGLGADQVYRTGVSLAGKGAVQQWTHPGWLGHGGVAIGGDVFGFSTRGLESEARLVVTSEGNPEGAELSAPVEGDMVWGGLARHGAEIITLVAESYESDRASVWRYDTTNGQVATVPLVGEGLDARRWFEKGDGPTGAVAEGETLRFVMRRRLWEVSLANGAGGEVAGLDIEEDRNIYPGANGIVTTWKRSGAFGAEIFDWEGRSLLRHDRLSIPGPADQIVWGALALA